MHHRFWDSSEFQKASQIQDEIRKINSGLNAAKSRVESLVLLNDLLSQCSTETLSQYTITWTRLLIQIIKGYAPASIHRLACYVLGSLTEKSSTCPELARQVALDSLPQLIPALLVMKEESLEAALYCIGKCMQFYSGPCGTFKGKIENWVIDQLTKENPRVVEAAVSVFPWLSQCGGGGNQGIKHAESWSSNCHKLLGSLHDTLDQLYEGVESGVEENKKKSEKLSLSPVQGTGMERIVGLRNRLDMLCGCLGGMLSTTFPAVVRIPVPEVIGFIQRALAVTGRALLLRPSTDNLQLLSVLPFLHTSVLRVLSCLISRYVLPFLHTSVLRVLSCLISRYVLPFLHTSVLRVLSCLILSCQKNLISYTSTVNQLLIQTLSWTITEDTADGRKRPYGNLRKEVYSTLVVWVQTLGASSNVHNIIDQLLTQLKRDITPDVDVIKLETINKKPDQYTEPPNKRKKGNKAGLEGVSTRKVLDHSANADVCLSALAALRHLLVAVGSLLKVQRIRDIQEIALPLALRVQAFTDQGSPGPYSDPECRRELYHVIQCLFLIPASKCPPPTHCVIRLFTGGQNDPDRKVSSFCQEALTICEAVIHPRVPSLQQTILWTVDGSKIQDVNKTSQVSKSTVDNSLFISGKNRQCGESIFTTSFQDSQSVVKQTNSLIKDDTIGKSGAPSDLPAAMDKPTAEENSSESEEECSDVAMETEEKEVKKSKRVSTTESLTTKPDDIFTEASTSKDDTLSGNGNEFFSVMSTQPTGTKAATVAPPVGGNRNERTATAVTPAGEFLSEDEETKTHKRKLSEMEESSDQVESMLASFVDAQPDSD
ncbi:proline-, glutamic acid- and leucine-rich protein 1-like [Lingula anatina]|uniref:Proline-, glutamic acid- and leucine-rich protein 1 n=1 Tax=Lingula anatina TaxID=7574 RepID=A0A1S3HU57_LINAN|nr:proline-, glutamic acid- and leucine-rich protein 1-like [Lingula anatina]|eukprot:XP_013388589.1 proline-, glutamic acid- and leucine-rich protein 1-like [Lingula anatina]